MQYYRRGTTWMSAQQAREYDAKGGVTVVEPTKEVVVEAVIEDKKVIVEDVISGKEIEVSQKDIDNAEEITTEEARDLPIVETALAKLEDVAPIEIKEETYAKEIGTKTKKSGKEKGTK